MLNFFKSTKFSPKFSYYSPKFFIMGNHPKYFYPAYFCFDSDSQNMYICINHNGMIIKDYPSIEVDTDISPKEIPINVFPPDVWIITNIEQTIDGKIIVFYNNKVYTRHSITIEKTQLGPLSYRNKYGTWLCSISKRAFVKQGHSDFDKLEGLFSST